MKLILGIFFVQSILFFAHAGREGGGGDPRAAQALIMAKQLAIFYKQNPIKLEIPFSADEFSKRVQVLENSFATPDQRHLIEFKNTVLYDKNHVEKAGTFDDEVPADEAQIRLSTSLWNNFTTEERLIQINIEILGIMKIKNRYELAMSLVHNHSALIASIPLPDDMSYHKKGWRISGQDPDQFGRLTNEDHILDGGTLGQGSELNKRMKNFLKNPLQDSAWTSQIMEAWTTQHRPFYLLFNSPDGNNASITAIYPIQENKEFSVHAYSLFFTKFRQIFEGPCTDTASSLSALDRLNNCYLDQSNYDAHDVLTRSLISLNSTQNLMDIGLPALTLELKNDLLHFYAHSEQNLSKVLLNYFITDYSSTIPSNQNTVRKAALSAFGLAPTLDGPFLNVPFWKTTKKKSIPDIRLYEASKALALHNLVFVDQNTQCQSFNSVSLVSRDIYEKEIGKCIYTTMGLEFPEPLYKAMTENGFYYDYNNQKWILEENKNNTHLNNK